MVGINAESFDVQIKGCRGQEKTLVVRGAPRRETGTVNFLCGHRLKRANRVTGNRFHNSAKLSNVKRNLDAATQFANALIIKAIKRPVQKTVGKFNIVDHFKEPGNAHKRINLFAIEQAGNLDFVIGVDFAGCVF